MSIKSLCVSTSKAQIIYILEVPVEKTGLLFMLMCAIMYVEIWCNGRNELIMVGIIGANRSIAMIV